MLQGLGCNTAKYVLTVLMDLFQHAIITEGGCFISDDNASEDDTAADAIDDALRQNGESRSPSDAQRGRR